MRLGNEYRRIWAGNAASNLADGITFVVIPLLAAHVTHNPRAIAALDVVYALPRILAVLGIGVLVDRTDRKRLLHASNFALAALFAILCAVRAADVLSMPILYAVFGTVGLVRTLADSSAFAVLPQAVSPEDLDRANSQITATQIVLDEFIGPPIGGLLFATAAFLPLIINVLAFCAAGLCYLALRGDYTVPTTEARPDRTVLTDIKEGFSWMRGNRTVLLLTVVGALASIGYMIPFSCLVLYASHVLGLNAAGYGLLLSASSLGGLAGSWAAGRLRPRIGYGWSIVAALALGSAAFIVVSATTNVVVVAVALAAYMCHAVVWNVLASSVRQKMVPMEVMGRVGSVSRLLGLTGLAVGALGGGWLAGAFGLRTPFAVAASLFAVASLLCVGNLKQLRAWERSTAEAAPASVVEAAAES